MFWATLDERGLAVQTPRINLNAVNRWIIMIYLLWFPLLPSDDSYLISSRSLPSQWYNSCELWFNQNLWTNWRTEIPLALQQARATWTGSEDAAKGKLSQKKAVYFTLQSSSITGWRKNSDNRKNSEEPYSCTIYPCAPWTDWIVPALPDILQVEAENLKVPQEKSACYLAWPLPAPQLISHAPLAVFQALPTGTILPLWEKFNIWLIKSTITSAADNQGTAYLLHSSSQEQAAKESAWVTLLNQPKNPPLGCWTASPHTSRPISSLQDTVSKGLSSASRGCWSLSTVLSTSLLFRSVNIISERQQKGQGGLGLPSSLGRNVPHPVQSLGGTPTDLCEWTVKLALSLLSPSSTGTNPNSSPERCYAAKATAFSRTLKGNGAACAD